MKFTRKLRESVSINWDDRAVSPVLGVALLIAITVILAGVVGFIVLGVDMGGPDTPSAQLAFSENETTTSGEFNVSVTHEGGDLLGADEIDVTIDNDSAAVTVYQPDDTNWTDGEMTAGDTEQLVEAGGEGDTVRVIWNDPNSDKTSIIGEYTIEG